MFVESLTGMSDRFLRLAVLMEHRLTDTLSLPAPFSGANVWLVTVKTPAHAGGYLPVPLWGTANAVKTPGLRREEGLKGDRIKRRKEETRRSFRARYVIDIRVPGWNSGPHSGPEFHPGL